MLRFARVAPRVFRAPIAVRWSLNLAGNELKTTALPHTFSNEPVVKYTQDHEWVALHPDGTAFVGISKYAADALGDATFVELPEVGDAVEKGDSIGAVESVKSASEVYAPMSGEITAVNTLVAEYPTLLNDDPMGEGWLAQVKVSDVESDFSENLDLMLLDEYLKFLEEDDH